MPNYTPNLNLEKPLQEEFYNVDVFNENADKIDAEMAKKANITHKHDGSTGNSSKITATEIAAGAADDAAIGNRTITDTTALAGTATTLTTLLGRIGNMIKSITGKSNWYTAPITTIEALNSNKAPNVHSSSATTYGISTATTYGHAMASNATPLVAGTAAVGTDNGKFARENHVHPAQTSVTGSSGSCTGNAATATTATSATTLTTARTIALSGKVTGTATSFNGSANISIPVTAVTADSCTGNSATATKLATARTINFNGAITGSGSFDGSSNITITTNNNVIDYIVESWIDSNGSSWYKKYNSGWIEQGLKLSGSTVGNFAVTFPKAFTTTSYFVNIGTENTTSWNLNANINNKSTTGCSVYLGNPSATGIFDFIFKGK